MTQQIPQTVPLAPRPLLFQPSGVHRPVTQVPRRTTAPNGDAFIAMLIAFRATGGTVRGDDLARLFEDRHCGDFVSLARLIATREVFSFGWRDSLWVPMFQFDLHDLSIKVGPRQVLAEFTSAFEAWDIANWFIHPNQRLQDRRPVDLLESDLADVLDAARAYRFVATSC